MILINRISIDYRDWNMIIIYWKWWKTWWKTINNNEATDAEKYFGLFNMLGDTLPGGYDADGMRKEVTFVGLYFNNPDEKKEEEERKKEKRSIVR